MSKTLYNTDASGASKNVKDIIFWGNGDMFKLICKASSEKEGWMKSTKAMEIKGVGCVVQVTTQQTAGTTEFQKGVQMRLESHDAVAEALTYVPGVKIKETKEGDEVVSRKLVAL